MTPVDRLLGRLAHVRQVGDGQWSARCPGHVDERSSLRVKKGANGHALAYCHAGCTLGDALAPLGLKPRDLFSPHTRSASCPAPHATNKSDKRSMVAYPYCDEAGAPLFEVVRYTPKRFQQRRADCTGGWVYNLTGVRRVLYRLPEVLDADLATTIFVVEGEKDADALIALGLVATTNSGGAGKWRPEYNEPLRERRVVILPDNDEPGRKHAAHVQRALQGVAASVQIVTLPGLPPKGDVSDWLAQGGTPAQLNALVAATTLQGVPADVPASSTAPATDAEHLSDLGNACRFIAAHGRDLRFVPARRQWLVYQGGRWAWDARLTVMQRGKVTIRGLQVAALALPDTRDRQELMRHALASESAPRLEAMVKLAGSEPGIPVAPEDLDADPYLLNCQNGTINLKTGTLMPHRRDQLLTKQAPVQYDPAARAEVWEAFVQHVAGNNLEVAAFLQRAVGYSLTGDTSEDVLFFLHGPTASGKSTFIEAIKATLGDYAGTTDFETFVVRRAGGVRNDVAGLVAVRFLASVEVEDRRRLAGAFVKQLTGGDTIAARFLYGEFFTFRPAFKLWLAANDAPRVRDNDDALWRRILRVPFEQTLPPGQRDKTLRATLRTPAARAAILAWAVQGCLAWRREGLRVPPLIDDATAAYRTAMDPLAEFLAQCCVIAPKAWVASNALLASYWRWARDLDGPALGPRDVWERLRARGFESAQRRVAGKATRGWKGLALSDAEGGPPAGVDTSSPVDGTLHNSSHTHE